MKREFDIRNLSVSSEAAFIIAEIGSNHDQSLDVAKRLIEEAAAAGADAVKFQSIDINELYYRPDGPTRELHKKIDLAEEWYHELKQHCDDEGVEFISSPTYMRAVDVLESLNVNIYKLASVQVAAFPQLVEKVAMLGKVTLLSTGLVTPEKVKEVVRVFERYGNDRYAILHCNSIYPISHERVNLRMVNIYEDMFNCPVGFSDHTNNIYAPMAAVAMGAKIIEKHFTLDRNRRTCDACVSLEPDQFAAMVEGIRSIEKSLAFKDRTELECEEKEFNEAVRYKLVVGRAKSAGDAFVREDFKYLRAQGGIDCKEEKYIVRNTRATGEISAGDLLTWNMLGEVDDD